MENLVDLEQFDDLYRGKRVLVTGHTGFKGSWLALWLTKLGAHVHGYSLAPPTTPNHLELLDLNIESTIGDIRDQDLLNKAFHQFQPEIVFHMAAQPLVRYSYQNPIETYETNIIGSLKVYEACRRAESVKVIISITTDKVYENFEVNHGYRESDRLGGKDPYSASKAAMEIMTQSYIHSFLSLDTLNDHGILLSSVRAGNVIGGGDWAQDRLIPDIIRATNDSKTVEIRSPHSVRPWQHVLDPLSGYLLLGQKLYQGHLNNAKPFNFGPPEHDVLTVKKVVEESKLHWQEIDYAIHEPKEKLHEAKLLMLNCEQAKKELNWEAILNSKESLKLTIEWYKAYYQSEQILTEKNLNFFLERALSKNAPWLKKN